MDVWIDRHRVWQEDDLIAACFDGPMGLAASQRFHARVAAVLAEYGRVYVLLDMARLTGIDAEARRYISDWHKTHRVTAVAVHGAGVTVRALSTLLWHAIRLIARSPMEAVMSPDEASARRWLAEKRARPV